MRFPITEHRVIRRRIPLPMHSQINAHPHPHSRGFGDTISKLTHATGIAQTVHKVEVLTGWNCWCPKVQAWLNQKFPYRLG